MIYSSIATVIIPGSKGDFFSFIFHILGILVIIEPLARTKIDCSLLSLACRDPIHFGRIDPPDAISSDYTAG